MKKVNFVIGSAAALAIKARNNNLVIEHCLINREHYRGKQRKKGKENKDWQK